MAPASRLKRWLPWTIAAIVLGTLVFALTQLPPAQPFDFLRGHAPEGKGIRPLKIGGKNVELDVLVYSFKADYDTLLANAEPELLGKGFTLSSKTDWGEGFKDASFTIDPGKGRQALVSLIGNRKTIGQVAHRRANQLMGQVVRHRPEDKGWVTITVVGVESPSLWRRLTSWLGF